MDVSPVIGGWLAIIQGQEFLYATEAEARMAVSNRPQVGQDENGVWTVTVGTAVYSFGTDATAAQRLATAATHMNAAAEWATGAKALLRALETTLTEALRLEMIYVGNDLYELTLATPSDAAVPGMDMLPIRSIAIGALMQDLMAFLAEATTGNPPAGLTLPTRRTVIVERD
jgi:hypothetical protein